MTTTPSLFTPNGDGYDIHPAGVLIILADTVYNSLHESTLAGRGRAKAMLTAILTAARAGGFKQADILETLLSTGAVSERVKAMAVAACNAAGPDAIEEIFASMRRQHWQP